MTTKLYDQDSHCRTFSAQVLSCTPVQGGQWHIVLDQTAFFPEGGGQPGDQGTLDTVRVLDTRERGDAIVHITDGPLTPGTSVTGELDWALRFARMQCHSGEHVLSGLAHSLYGCTNVGFHMGEDQVILDFDKELTPQQLTVLEDRANQIITENRPVTARYPAPEELAALDYRSKLDLTEQVRIVTIAGCDVCACCAPHVTCTGEIGLVKLVDAMRHRGGIRLWMVAGRLALADYQRKQTNIAAISAALSVQQPQAAQGVERLKQELQTLKETLKQTRQALLAEKAKALPQTPGNLCLFEDDLDGTGLRVLANAGMERCGGICAVFAGTDQAGYRYAMGSQTVDLRAKAKEAPPGPGGKGRRPAHPDPGRGDRQPPGDSGLLPLTTQRKEAPHGEEECPEHPGENRGGRLAALLRAGL